MNRKQNLLESPNSIHFINQTLHSTEYPRIAKTRKLTNMNKQKQFTLGIIHLSLTTSDIHLTLQSE